MNHPRTAKSVETPQKEQRPLTEPLCKVNDARGCNLRTETGFPVTSFNQVRSWPWRRYTCLTFSQFGGKIVFGLRSIEPHLYRFKIKPNNLPQPNRRQIIGFFLNKNNEI